MSKFVVITLPADGLALLGARASAGIGMMKHQSLIYRDHFVYAPSQWETTLQCNASLIGWEHTQNDPTYTEDQVKRCPMAQAPLSLR